MVELEEEMYIEPESRIHKANHSFWNFFKIIPDLF